MKPLAEQLRPQSLDQYLGQEHLIGQNGALRKSLSLGRLPSIILWGPPGVGKTTLALLLAKELDAPLYQLSAVNAGVKDVREVLATAEKKSLFDTKRPILFIDEIHRFNKGQQDSLLHAVERGWITLIGATTENPSFEVNKALLSRCQVYTLKALDDEALQKIIDRVITKQSNLNIEETAQETLLLFSSGDARRLINLLEMAIDQITLQKESAITNEIIKKIISEKTRHFDKSGDQFYDQISALHKSVRGSDPNAALYWLFKMLDGGADPLYLARRIVRIAIEDIGVADPRAQTMALEAYQIYERLGFPEGELALSNAVIYLAMAPKSNSAYVAYNDVKSFIKDQSHTDVPLHLRNAPTQLMSDLNYGKDYRYAHNEPYAYAAGEKYFPDDVEPVKFYNPTDRGLEKKISDKLDFLKSLDEEYNKRKK